MKRVITLSLAVLLGLQSPAQIELPKDAYVIITNRANNTVFARLPVLGTIFRFKVSADDLKKFKPDLKFGILYDANKAIINNVKIHVTDIEVVLEHAKYFSMNAVYYWKTNDPAKNSKPAPRFIMKTIYDKHNPGDNHIQACCEPGTQKGVEFTIPEGLNEPGIEPQVYVVKNMVYLDIKRSTGWSEAMAYPVTGNWIDSTADTTSHGATANTSPEIDGNIAMRPPTGNIKDGLGRLNTNFPDSIDWAIDIYTPSKKFIIHRSKSDNIRYMELEPGSYSVRLNTVMVERIPIVIGQETLLRVGFLVIQRTGHWDLYDESKSKFLTSGNKQVKIVLPVGSYQLKQNGKYTLLVVTEGSTSTQ